MKLIVSIKAVVYHEVTIEAKDEDEAIDRAFEQMATECPFQEIEIRSAECERVDED